MTTANRITTVRIHGPTDARTVALPYPMTGAEIVLWAESTYGTPLGPAPDAVVEPNETGWLFLSVTGDMSMVVVVDE